MASNILLLTFYFILGTAIGSFLNVWSRRLIRGKSPTGRSRCEHCKRVLSAADLVPLLSFALLRGRCHYCKTPLSWQYPLVEFGTGLLFASLSFQLLITNYQLLNFLAFSFLLVSVSALIVVFITDFSAQVIFDQALWVAVGGAFLYRLFVHLPAADYRLLAYDLIGALGVFLFFQAIRGITRRRGLGEGDLPLGLVAALLVGFPLALVELFLAFVGGGLTAFVLLLLGKRRLKDQIAFGPFLVSATFITLFWGKVLLDWYLGFLG